MCRFIVNLCTLHAALYQTEYVSYGIIVLASKIGGTQTYTTPKVKLLEGQGDRRDERNDYHWIRMGIFHNSSKEWKVFVIKCQACMLFIFE